MKRLKGVESVAPGYAGGTVANPTYQRICNGNTGHAEVIQVTYDPNVVSLDILFSVFFATHDPTVRNRQGNDVGTQYRSIILYTNEEQKNAAEAFTKKLESEKTFSKPLVTELKALDMFYPAEEYHRDYYDRNQDQPYCQFVIDPKIKKLREKFAGLLKD